MFVFHATVSISIQEDVIIKATVALLNTWLKQFLHSLLYAENGKQVTDWVTFFSAVTVEFIFLSSHC